MNATEALKGLWQTVLRYPRLFRGLALVLALLFVIDFVTSVWVWRSSELRQFQAPVARVYPSGPDAGWVKAQLERWFTPPTASNESDSAQEAGREIVLEGIFGVPGRLRAALVLKARDGVTERVTAAVGDSVEGWTVLELSAKRAILSKDGQSREWVMFQSLPAAPPAAPENE